LDTIDNCKVVFDVTQISYQSSDRVYQASRALQRKFSLYRAQKANIAVYSVYLIEKVNEGKFSVYLVEKVNEGKFSVYLVEKVNEGKFSVYLVEKVNEEDQCLPSSLGVQRISLSCVMFTEFTRCPKDFAQFCSVYRASLG
jgi:hypothetical protein